MVKTIIFFKNNLFTTDISFSKSIVDIWVTECVMALDRPSFNSSGFCLTLTIFNERWQNDDKNWDVNKNLSFSPGRSHFCSFWYVHWWVTDLKLNSNWKHIKDICRYTKHLLKRRFQRISCFLFLIFVIFDIFWCLHTRSQILLNCFVLLALIKDTGMESLPCITWMDFLPVEGGGGTIYMCEIHQCMQGTQHLKSGSRNLHFKVFFRN